MHDLPRIVADTAVGKVVDVVVIRKGKEETHKVTIGRLEDSEKVAMADAEKNAAPPQKSVVQKTLGLELSSLSDDVRKQFKIGDSIKGVVVTGVDPNVAMSDPDKRLTAGRCHRRSAISGRRHADRSAEARRRSEIAGQEDRRVAGIKPRRRNALCCAEPAVAPRRRGPCPIRRQIPRADTLAHKAAP